MKTTTRKKKRRSSKPSAARKNSVTSVLLRSKPIWFGLAFMVIGAATLLFTSAATTNAFEPETGTLAGDCVSKVSDTDASGSQAVAFTCAPLQATGQFVHPGVVMSKDQLDFVKAKITVGEEPWKSAFSKLKSSSYAGLTYTPKPVAVLSCSSSTTTDDATCNAYMQDAYAAYAHALMWYYTGNEAHAKKSIQILDAWSSTLREIKFDNTINQGKLYAGWGAELNTRSAEIVRHTYTGWDGAAVSRYESFLKTVVYPVIQDGWTSGSNWLTTFAEAMINIGVFTNDKVIYEKGLAYWREKVPTVIYMNSDGAYPLPQSSIFKTQSQIDDLWRNPTRYLNGLTQEICRDLGHSQMAQGALFNAAETALIQGTDLYSEQQARILASMELQAVYANEYFDVLKGAAPGTDAPAGWKPTTSQWVCTTPFVDGGGATALGWEVGYNHYAQRKGISLPQTKKVVERLRPSDVGNHMAWETLTHAGTGTIKRQGEVSGTVSVTTNDTHTIWVRMRAADATNNAVQLVINGTAYKMGDSTIATAGWTWVNFQNGSTADTARVALTAGTHPIKLFGIEPGVSVDKLLLLTGTCIPVKDGANCTNIPPTVALNSPQAAGTVTEPGTVVLNAQASDSDGAVVKVEFYLGASLIGEDTSAPFTYTAANLGSDSYSFSARAYDNIGMSAVSNTIALNIQPKPAAVLPLPVPSGMKVSKRTESSMTLTWDKSTDSRVDRYNVRFAKRNSPTFSNYATWSYPAHTAGNSITITGLDANTTYVFQVRARQSQGTTDTSDDMLGLYTNSIQASTTSKKRFVLF
jgi:hypothetical protein